MVARYIGCSGAHQDDNGNWLPCANSETMNRISEEAYGKKSDEKQRRKRRLRKVQAGYEPLGERGVTSIDTLSTGGLVGGKSVIIGRAKPRKGDPDVFTDPNSARLRSRQLGCIGIARRETPDGEVVWTPCTNVSDQRRRMGQSVLGRRDESRRFAERLEEVGGREFRNRRLKKKEAEADFLFKALLTIGQRFAVGAPNPIGGKKKGKCTGLSIRDGDGDGFICNPATGQDDLPLVGAAGNLKKFYDQAIADKKTWKDKLKANPFRKDEISFKTPDGHADVMLANMAKRGFIITRDENTISVIPPPEFRKRYLAFHAVTKGQGVDDVNIAMAAIGYHIWHPGNDEEGPERQMMRTLLRNFGYDALNDNLYSPYEPRPNSWNQVANPENIRKFARGIIPEFEGIEGAQNYLTDAVKAKPWKDAGRLEEDGYIKNLRRLDVQDLAEAYEELRKEGKAVYGLRDPMRKPDEDEEDLVDFFSMVENKFGPEEIAEVMNFDIDSLRSFMEKEKIDINDNAGIEAIAEVARMEAARKAKPPRPADNRRVRQGPAPFRQGPAAVPPTLKLDPEKRGAFTYDEFAEVVKWMGWADDSLRNPIPQQDLQKYLRENPRLALGVRSMTPRMYENIFDLRRNGKDPFPVSPELVKQNEKLFQQMQIEYLRRNVEDMVDFKLPEGMRGMDFTKADIRRILDILMGSGAREEKENRLRELGLDNIYLRLHWAGFLPLLVDGPKASDVFKKASVANKSFRHFVARLDFKAARAARSDRLAATPSKPEERIRGSQRNPAGTAASSSSGSSISIDAATEQALANKVREHNDKMRKANKPASSMATLGKLKAVYRRGAGAFSVSHRPGMTRGQWAMGRVNAFLKILSSGKPNNARYVGDNDLLSESHPWRKRS